MVKTIESYNASYPAAFYEIGTVYSFYSVISSKGSPAPQEYINRYSSTLKELEPQQRPNAIRPVGGNASAAAGKTNELSRYYAVVVSKSASTIEIMFMNEDNGRLSYLTRKYAVSNACTTDGKDLMTPTTKTNISGTPGNEKRIGGITRAAASTAGKVGGITKAGQNTAASAHIGGITRVKSQDSDNNSTPAAPVQPTPKVGGITRIKK